ncbi:hypothetical protein GGI16_006610 [Coemansia sp. S142-1]|nr:hypothetical protein GGI16_006610 [Coemansia sp. S142-1]
MFTPTRAPLSLANESAPWLEPRLAHYGLDMAAAAADAALEPLLTNESAPWDTSGKEYLGLDLENC